jgi:hypothetical protein
MRVGVSRNYVPRHPPGATRAIFNKQGWGVSSPVKLKINLIKYIRKYIRKFVRGILAEKIERGAFI